MQVVMNKCFALNLKKIARIRRVVFGKKAKMTQVNSEKRHHRGEG